MTTQVPANCTVLMIYSTQQNNHTLKYLRFSVKVHILCLLDKNDVGEAQTRKDFFFMNCDAEPWIGGV